MLISCNTPKLTVKPKSSGLILCVFAQGRRQVENVKFNCELDSQYVSALVQTG